MNPENPTNLPALPPAIAAAIHTHRRRLRWLTGIAWGLGLVAAFASIAIVSVYFTAYRPRILHVLNDLGARFTALPPAPGAPPAAIDLVAQQTAFTHALSVGTMLIAAAVGLLAAGTLVLLLVVLFTRRATLAQIQASLAQISAQLQALQGPAPRG